MSWLNLTKAFRVKILPFQFAVVFYESMTSISGLIHLIEHIDNQNLQASFWRCIWLVLPCDMGFGNPSLLEQTGSGVSKFVGSFDVSYISEILYIIQSVIQIVSIV